MYRIETPQGKGRFSYHELGMSDGRTRDKRPSMLWKLLKLFAEHQGFISSKSEEYDPTLPDTAKRLNQCLQKIFNINVILQQNSGVGVKPLFYYSNIPTHNSRVIYNHS
jgi:hypothetical protein